MSGLFQSVSVSLDAPGWRDALRPRPLPAASRRFREQLGLDPDRPVVMSGHQPTIWHAGILAKWAAMTHAARLHHASAAWLVVDQDRVAPFDVRWPALTPAGLAVRTEQFGARPPRAQDELPACLVPALSSPQAGSAEGAPLRVACALRAIALALTQHRALANAAAQTAHAVRDMAGLALSAPPPALVFASTLASTQTFGEMVERLRREAPACIGAYNAAAARHPGARIRPLHPARLELPLWRLSVGAGREPVFADEPDKPGFLAPRALLTTLLMRRHACDLFIHGTGGGDARDGYDRVMEDWARAWLGDDLPLAPSASVTATCRMDLGKSTGPSPARAAWEAHHARHDPALLGDPAAAAEKLALVEEIANAQPPRRRELYARLHTLLASVRGARHERLAALEASARSLAAHAREEHIREDRTWAFPFLDPATLHAMQHQIAQHIGGRT